MSRHLITILLLLGAIALYITGMAIHATVALVAGGLLELWFWIRLLRG